MATELPTPLPMTCQAGHPRLAWSGWKPRMRPQDLMAWLHRKSPTNGLCGDVNSRIQPPATQILRRFWPRCSEWVPGWFDHVKATLVDIQTLPHDFDLYKVAPRYNLDYNHYQHLSTVVDLSWSIYHKPKLPFSFFLPSSSKLSQASKASVASTIRNARGTPAGTTTATVNKTIRMVRSFIFVGYQFW